MSLTSIIKSDKELRQKINTTFLRPKLDKNKPLLIESNTNHASTRSHPSSVGMHTRVTTTKLTSKDK